MDSPQFPQVNFDLQEVYPAQSAPIEPAPIPQDTEIPWNTSPVDQAVIEMVTSRKKASEDFRRDKKNVLDKCWEHMLQVYDSTGKEYWQSQRFWPETPKVVETIVANLHAAHLVPKVPIEWQVKVKEAEEDVRNVNDMVQNDTNQGRFKLSFTDNLRELAILGTTVGRVDYEYCAEEVMVKTRRRAGLMDRSMAQYTGQPVNDYNFDSSIEKKVTADYAVSKYVDLYKIFPEPGSTEISKKNWIIQADKIKNAELIRLANDPDEYYRLENITAELLSSPGNNAQTNDPLTQNKDDALLKNTVTIPHLDPDMEHELLEYWGPAPAWMVYPDLKENDDYKYKQVNGWFWVIDGKWLVRRKINCYRDGEPPYFKIPYIKVPGDWYGIGPVELMMFLQIEKNELVNTALDNINIMLNKMVGILKDKVSKEDWARLESVPGGLWLFENTDDIRKVMMPIEFQNLLRDIYLAIEMVDRAIQEVTGAVKATLGVGGGSDEAGGGTLGGQVMNKQAASERFMLYARTIEASGLSDCFRKMYHRIYQFKTYENVEKIIGKERFKNFEFITPEDLDAVADLVPLGVMTLETKGVRLAQMDQFAQRWQGRQWLKEYDLARRTWIEMGNTDPDSVIFSPEEMAQFNDMRRQMMSQMGGPGSETQVNAGGGEQPSIESTSPTGPMGTRMPMGAMPAQGPGVASQDFNGMPMR
jgi:hypothetical protein